MNEVELKTKLKDNKLPRGWQSVRFKDIAENKKFAIVDGPFGTQLHADEYLNEGIPVVRVTNLSFNGKFLEDNFVFINKKKANILKRSEVIPGDIIIAKTGATIGKSGIFPTNLHKGIIASSCLKFTTKRKKFSEKYILYFIAWHKGQKQILNGASGSTRTTINIIPFSNIEIYLPFYLSEQCKIAEILETVDETIEKTDAIIEKYKRIKQGLMQDLLTRGIDGNGKIRSEKTHKFKKSLLGRISEEWEVAELGETTIFIKDGTHGTHKDVDDGIYLLSAKDVVQGKLLFPEDSRKISEKDYLTIMKNYKFEIGDILLTIVGTIGRVSYINGTEPNFAVQRSVAILRFKRFAKYLYPFYYLQFDLFQKQLENNINALAQGGVYLKTLNSLKIAIPKSKDEQRRIVKVLFQIDETIKKEQKYKEKLERIKQGLMEDLLTGKVRVNLLIKEGLNE